MPSTIKDVAKKAKVSIATVSLVLHNNQRISLGTKRKVLKAVSDLDYRPSRIARGLVLKETKNIGFLLTHDHFLRSEPFYTHIFLGTEFEARDHEYYILLNTIPTSFNACDSLPRCVKENNVDGIIIAGKVPQDIVNCLEPYHMPLVFVDYYPSSGAHYAVLIDNVEGGRKATEHLISLGHRRIAFLGGDLDHPSIRDRFRGYRQALEEKEIEYDAIRVITTESMTSRECGYHAAKELYKRSKKNTSIFACNDAMALGAMQYFKTAGLRIPADISIIGFDDVEAGLTSEPPLTTMMVPKVELGSQTMKIMVSILENKLKKPHKVLIPVELVIRASTCAV